MVRARLSAVIVASVGLAAALLFSACGEVPGLRFGDAGAPDGGAADAKPDRAASDGAVDGSSTCPAAAPFGTNGCCDDTACIGNNCEQQCEKCTGCNSGEYCCTTGSVRCISPGAQCQ